MFITSDADLAFYVAAGLCVLSVLALLVIVWVNIASEEFPPALPVRPSVRDEPWYHCHPGCTREDSPEPILLKPVRPCGDGDLEHFEDVPLAEVLNVGRVYETVAAREGVRCGSGGGVMWMAWIRSYVHPKCCGIDELVAFAKEPPKFFVYTENARLLGIKNGLQKSGRVDPAVVRDDSR